MKEVSQIRNVFVWNVNQTPGKAELISAELVTPSIVSLRTWSTGTGKSFRYAG
jgi:hypothetical protein